MSRVGKKIISIPQGVKINIQNSCISVEGQKGKLKMDIPENITLLIEKETLIVKRATDEKVTRSLHGTVRALIQNMITGVSQGFKKDLDIVGVGFKAQMKGKNLLINVGFSHPVEMIVPAELKVSAPSQIRITIEGVDKQLVGEFTAKVRDIFKPEPYKGKGIRYAGEVVRKKLGKALAKK